MHANDVADGAETKACQPVHPTITTRKNSFSDALNKFTDKANPFGHRRRMTTAALPTSTSLASVSNNESYPSRLPTASGIPRSASFFGGLNARVTPQSDENSSPLTSTAAKERRNRRISDKLTQLPFFDHECQTRDFQTPLMSRGKGDSTIKIQQRGLMAPIQPASLPQSSTICNIAEQYRDTQIPNLKHPTSSRAHHRHQSGNTAQEPTHLVPQVPSNGSLLNSPALAYLTFHKPTVRSTAPGYRNSPSASLSTCLPIRKDSIALHDSPPARAVAPAATLFTAPQEAIAIRLASFAHSAHMPPATRLPTPAIALLTPEYEDLEEDLRDRRAKYVEPKSDDGIDDKGQMTAPINKSDVDMLNTVKSYRSVVDEDHLQASYRQVQSQSSVNDEFACDGVTEADCSREQAGIKASHLVSEIPSLSHKP